MRGLTLIETLLYFALLTILMLAATTLATSVSGTSERDREVIQRQEELLFMLRKMEWAHARASSAEVTPRVLRLRSTDDSIDPVIITVEETAIELSIGGNDAAAIFPLQKGDKARFTETEMGFAFSFENDDLSLERHYISP